MTKLNRRVHFLRSGTRVETPTHAVWFDTESDQDVTAPGVLRHRLTFGWGAYRRKRSNGEWTKPDWIRFTTASQFWDFIEEKSLAKTRLYIFCHNTSFDIPLLDGIGELSGRGFKLNMAVIDAPPTILKYRRENASLVVLDTLNIFRMALKDLGKSIGLEKYDMPDVTTSSKEADDYCRRDVEIIMQSCIKWWTFIIENDLGSFAHTLAGQAMRAFRHRFMEHRILIDDNAEGTAVSRRAYYGGRTECFRLGRVEHRTWLYDVNSMYPAVMRGNMYPTQIIAHTKYAGTGDIATWLKSHCVSARVVLRTDVPAYPLRRDNKLVFPTGSFETCLTSPELSYALERGHIVKVREAALYHRAEIFTSFVDYFYTSRLTAAARGDKVTALLYKILMNSLYGKFGQRGLIWEAKEQTTDLSSKVWEEYDLDTHTVHRYRQLGGLVQVQEREAESRDSHPAIAAHVTAYARLLLWDMINRAGRENVYYVDTDSLLVNAAGRAGLETALDETTLGGLKLEDTFPDAEIFGPKDYRFGERRKTKGVKKSALWTSPSSVEQQHWSTLKAHVRAGPGHAPVTRTVRKSLARVYNKGVPMPDGTIQPFDLEL